MWYFHKKCSGRHLLEYIFILFKLFLASLLLVQYQESNKRCFFSATKKTHTPVYGSMHIVCYLPLNPPLYFLLSFFSDFSLISNCSFRLLSPTALSDIKLQLFHLLSLPGFLSLLGFELQPLFQESTASTTELISQSSIHVALLCSSVVVLLVKIYLHLVSPRVRNLQENKFMRRKL